MDRVKEFFKSPNFLVGLLLLGVFIFGFSTTYFVLTFMGKPKEKPRAVAVVPTETDPTPEPFEPIDTERTFNVVLLGSGGAGHSGGTLTDSIIVVSIDSKMKRVAFISIPRDLWVPGNYKINASVLNLGYENFKGVLQNITGLKIDNFVAIDFAGMVKLIDSLGGIEVEVPKTFDDYFYPIKGLENETCGLTPEQIAEAHEKYSGFELEKQFVCRWEHIHFDKGRTGIDGETALKFARSRHGDSDFGRSMRQFAILKGIEEKIELSDVGEAYAALSKIVKTDLGLETARELSKLFGSPKDYSVVQIQLTEDNVLSASRSSDGQYILIPKVGVNNFSGIKDYITQ